MTDARTQILYDALRTIYSSDDLAMQMRSTAGAALEQYDATEPKIPRFTYHAYQPSERVTRHQVLDHVQQQEVFHWYGDTGREKCEAVVAALNALGHEKD